MDDIKSSSHLHTLGTLEDIKDLPLVKIRQIHRQLSSDLEELSQVSDFPIPFIFFREYDLPQIKIEAPV